MGKCFMWKFGRKILLNKDIFYGMVINNLVRFFFLGMIEWEGGVEMRSN